MLYQLSYGPVRAANIGSRIGTVNRAGAAPAPSTGVAWMITCCRHGIEGIGHGRRRQAGNGRYGQRRRLAAAEVAEGDRSAPALAKELNNLGNSLGDAGRNEAAVILLRKALALWPDYALAHANLAAILIRLTRYEDALAHLARANELAAPTADWLCLQGSAYQN